MASAPIRPATGCPLPCPTDRPRPQPACPSPVAIARLRGPSRSPWRPSALMVAHRAEAGDRLGRGVHAGSGGPDSRVVQGDEPTLRPSPRKWVPPSPRSELVQTFPGDAPQARRADREVDSTFETPVAEGARVVLAVRPRGAARAPAVLRDRRVDRRRGSPPSWAVLPGLRLGPMIAFSLAGGAIFAASSPDGGAIWAGALAALRAGRCNPTCSGTGITRRSTPCSPRSGSAPCWRSRGRSGVDRAVAALGVGGRSSACSAAGRPTPS